MTEFKIGDVVTFSSYEYEIVEIHTEHDLYSCWLACVDVPNRALWPPPKYTVEEILRMFVRCPSR